VTERRSGTARLSPFPTAGSALLDVRSRLVDFSSALPPVEDPIPRCEPGPFGIDAKPDSGRAHFLPEKRILRVD